MNAPLDLLRTTTLRSLRIRHAAALALVGLITLATSARAQGTFDGCGTVVPGVTCPELFQPDSGGLWVVNGLSSYALGTHVHVNGVINTSCFTICQQGNGCIDQATVSLCEPGTAFCFGDGTQGNCPCSNNGNAGHGCDNSVGTHGAVLGSSGTTSPDTVVLTSSGELPTATSILLQGDANIPAVTFGDGLRCAGGVLKRIGVHGAVSGTVSYPQTGDNSITQQSANLGDPIAPGSTRYYQFYYRDPNPTFCPAPPGNTWNASSGVSIVW